VRRIEQILADPAAKTDEIEDPRKYFNFELYIKDGPGAYAPLFRAGQQPALAAKVNCHST
jgi:hypothetical protein